jgi:mRNA-degrading endonuclease RelE of RelBE toxin-antitoxin system
VNRIEWTRKATKQLRKLDRQYQVQVRDGVDALRNFPECGNVKALSNHRYDYRLRIGNYRVFFEFEQVVRIVTIQEVKKRDERTY